MKMTSLPFAKWNSGRWCAWLLLLFIFSIPLAYSESFYHPFMALKWLLFYICGAICAVSLIFSESLVLPKGPLFKLTLILLFFKVASVAVTPNWYSFHSLFNAFVIGITILALMNLFVEKRLRLKDFYWPLAFSSAVLLGFAWVQYYFHRWIARAEDPQYFSTLFGNINYSSQYFVMAVPMLAYFSQTTKGWRQGLANFFLTNFIFFSIAGLSRSSIIGISLWFLYRLCTKISRAELGCVLVAGLMFGAHQSLDLREQFYANAKKESFGKRTELYKGSLKMLLDYPMGIGGEAYEYGYVPYQLSTQEAPTPAETYNNPHSEFLKWGIENGWGFLLTVLLWFACLLWQIWRTEMKKEDRVLLLSLFAAVAADLAFQFPFENAPTLALFCVYFGFSFSLLPQRRLNVAAKRLLWVPVSLLLILHAGAYGISKYNEGSYMDHVDESMLACDLYPVNYRICFYGSRLLAPRFALPYITMELRQRPFNYSHLRLFAVTLYHGLNETDDGCELQSMYLQLLPRENRFLTCNRQKYSPIPYVNPTQFRDDFTNRLSRLLNKY